ncbi:MAG: VanZ family protein [Crocinitomicaceae bacterium]|nr:VanZ family protein [Crocinitomicaceae bacterium]
MRLVKISLIIVIVGIIYLSLMPPNGPVEITINDKIGHFVAYSVLMLNAGLLFFKNNWWKVALVVFLFSASLEFLQQFVPGRESDLKDMIANGTGVVIGWGVLFIFYSKIIELLKWLKIIKIKSI